MFLDHYHGRSWSTSNQIDVDSDLSSNNELLEEVVRARMGETTRSCCPIGMAPGLWLNMVNVKPPYLLDLEIERRAKKRPLRTISERSYNGCQFLGYLGRSNVTVVLNLYRS